MPYLPSITSFVPKRLVRLGDTHMATVGSDCESVGSIDYIHIMLVSKVRENSTIFAVASEASLINIKSREEGKIPSDKSIVALGVFPCNDSVRHINLGFSDDYLDFDHFTQVAVDVTSKHLFIGGRVLFKDFPPNQQGRVPFINPDL